MQINSSITLFLYQNEKDSFKIYNNFSVASQNIIIMNHEDSRTWRWMRNISPVKAKYFFTPETLEESRSLIKRGVREHDLINEISPKKMIHVIEERKTFKEKTEAFLELLFYVQQRNFILNPFLLNILNKKNIKALLLSRIIYQQIINIVVFLIVNSATVFYTTSRKNLIKKFYLVIREWKVEQSRTKINTAVKP